MMTPQLREFFVMDMFRDFDPLVQDTYGQVYQGQQTGDMIHNDSHVLYSMDQDWVEERTDDWCEDRKNYWMSLTMGGELIVTEYPYTSQNPGTDLIRHDFQITRAAPTPDVMLAFLIKDGHLPYGDYLMEVSW